MKTIQLLPTALLAIVLPTAVRATNYYWTGAIDSDFTNPANWSGGSVPPSSTYAHNIVLDDTYLTGNTVKTVSLPGNNFNIAKMTVNSTGWTCTGNTLFPLEGGFYATSPDGTNIVFQKEVKATSRTFSVVAGGTVVFAANPYIDGAETWTMTGGGTFVLVSGTSLGGWSGVRAVNLAGGTVLRVGCGNPYSNTASDTTTWGGGTVTLQAAMSRLQLRNTLSAAQTFIDNGKIVNGYDTANYNLAARDIGDGYVEVYLAFAGTPEITAASLSKDANGAFAVSATLGTVSATLTAYADDGVNAPVATLLGTDVAGAGTASATLSGLSANTTYYVYTVAANAAGTVTNNLGAIYNGVPQIAGISDALELGLVPGTGTVSRAAAAAYPLTVNLVYAGAAGAVEGQTYATPAATVTIPAGAASAPFEIVPLTDPSVTVDSSVVATLAAGDTYLSAVPMPSASIGVLNSAMPSDKNVWIASSDGLASNGDNWSQGVPTTSSDILFDGTFSTARCIWDAAATHAVASWTQNANFPGTVQIETTYADGVFPLLSIAGDCDVNGGTWTHHTNTNVTNGMAAQYRLNVSVGGDFTLGSGAKIDAIGIGYNVGRCPAGSQVGVHAATGRGTYSAVYGDVRAPEDIGSGGESGNKNTSAGGGAVKIAVAGTAVIDGTIAANACSQKLNGNNPEKGYGAGGSVFVTASSISGSGKVDVSARPAGISETAYTDYPGSGGRMALVATSGSVTIPMANLLANGSWGRYSAGAGTIYLKNASDTNGSLLVGNNAINWSYQVRYPRKDGCTCVKPGETWTFDHVYVRDSGILSVPVDATLSLPGGFESVSSLTDSSTPLCGILYLGGTISLPVRQEHVLSGPWMFMAAEPFTFDGDVRLTSKASIGSLQLYADSIGAYPVCKVFVTGDMTVESGASLYAQDRGIKGASFDPGFGYHGGSVANQTGDLSRLFDSILNPVLCGSGARKGDMGNTNPGGGAIVLTVGGTLTLNGNANAGTSAVGSFHVGGAGTINITAGSLAGTGNITANGGSGSGAKSRGSGGGGRVAVRLTGANATFDGFSGTIAAQGANANSATTPYGSSAGTVYLQDGNTAAGAGTIRIANLTGSTAVDAKTGFPALSNGEPIDDLSKATLAISNNSTVILVADVKVGVLDIASGSTIDLNGHTITVKRAKLGDTKFSSGEYTAADAEVSGFVTDSVGGGSLVVRGIGTVLLLN